MKILFDALGSTEYSGGMRLHSTEVIRTWSEEFPQDEIGLVSGKWAKKDIGSGVSQIWTWHNEAAPLRAIGQLLSVAVIAKVHKFDAIISLSPIVTPLSHRTISVCYQHDWRHLSRPSEFSQIQRIYRLLWKKSAKWADITVCISNKTVSETNAVVPSANVILSQNGWDHARRWTNTRNLKNDGRISIVTFGHHNNKRPELVIDALASIAKDVDSRIVLTILGARGEYAESLIKRGNQLGIRDQIEIPGFVAQAEYEHTIANASCIVMASTDEGFGLPIAEAIYFGIPAIVTSDSGMQSVFGNDVIVAGPSGTEVAGAIRYAIGLHDRVQSREFWKWKQAVAVVREAIVEAKQSH